MYLISTWYTRYEVQTRFALFYLLGCFASALSGILAYGLMQMVGVLAHRLYWPGNPNRATGRRRRLRGLEMDLHCKSMAGGNPGHG